MFCPKLDGDEDEADEVDGPLEDCWEISFQDERVDDVCEEDGATTFSVVAKDDDDDVAADDGDVAGNGDDDRVAKGDTCRDGINTDGERENEVNGTEEKLDIESAIRIDCIWIENNIDPKAIVLTKSMECIFSQSLSLEWNKNDFKLVDFETAKDNLVTTFALMKMF